LNASLLGVFPTIGLQVWLSLGSFFLVHGVEMANQELEVASCFKDNRLKLLKMTSMPMIA